MDKELKLLLDQARANGASRQQLEDILARYNAKKKEQPQEPFQFGVSDTESVSPSAAPEIDYGIDSFSQESGVTAKEVKDREDGPTVGQWFGNIYNGLIEGVEDFLYPGAESVGATDENILDFIEQNEERHPELYDSYLQSLEGKTFQNLGYEEDKAKELAARTAYSKYWESNPDIENEVMPYIRQERRETAIESKGVEIPKDIKEELDEEFWNSSLKGLASSLPAMAASPATMGGSFVVQSYYAKEEEIGRLLSENPDLEMSKSQQEAYKITGALVEGTLEKIGLSGALKGSPVVAKLITSEVLERALKSGRKATKETINRYINESVQNITSRIAGGSLAEFETGALQQLSDDAIKGVFNAARDRQFFEPKTLANVFKDALYAGAQEAVGGGLISGVASVGTSSREKRIRDLQEEVENLTNKRDAALTEEEKSVVDDVLTDVKKNMSDEIQESYNQYKEFSEEDLKAVSDINTKIRDAANKYNVAESSDLKKKYREEVEELRSQKEAIERKYDSKEEERVPSPEQESEAPVEEQPVAEPSEEEAPADRDVQEAEEEVEIDQEAVNLEEETIADAEFRIEDLQSEIEIEKGNIKEAKAKSKEDITAVRKSKLSKEEKAEKIEELKAELQDAVDDMNGNIGIYKEDIRAFKSDIRKANKKLDKLRAPKTVKKTTKKQVAPEAVKSEELDIILLDEVGGQKELTSTGGTDPRNIETGKMTVEYGEEGLTFKTESDTGRMKEEGGEMFIPYSLIEKMPNINKFEKGTKDYAYHVAALEGIADAYEGDPVDLLMDRLVKPENIGKKGTNTENRFTEEDGKRIASMISNYNKIAKRLGKTPPEFVFAFDRDIKPYYRYTTGEEKKSRTKGSYLELYNKVIINLDKADAGTVAHELTHAYIRAVKLDRNKVVEFTNILEAELAKGNDLEVELGKELGKFRDEYVNRKIYGERTKDDPNIAEEFLAEYVGTMFRFSDKLPPAKQASFVEKIRAAVVKFLAKLGVIDKNLAVKINTREEALNFINGFVDALQGRTEATADTEVQPEEQGESGEVGTISIPKEQIEVIDAPKASEDPRDFVRNFVSDVKINELKDRKFVTNMYDYTNAGLTQLGNGLSINLLGGRNYVPLMLKLNGKKLGEVSNLAAFNTKAQAEGFIRNAEEGKADLFAPHSGTLTDSWQFQHHIFEELVNLVLDNKIMSNSGLINLFNDSIRNSEKSVELSRKKQAEYNKNGYYTVTKKGEAKKIYNEPKAVLPLKDEFITFAKVYKEKTGKNIKNFASFKKDPAALLELLNAENNYSPDLRKLLNQRLAASKDFQKAIGIKNLKQFYNLIADPLNEGVSGGEIMTFVEFDPKTFEVVKTESGDVNHHPSFGWVVMAKIKRILQPNKYYKSYDLTKEYTKYNVSGPEVSTKEDPKFAVSNVTSSAGAIPKVAKVAVKEQIDFAGIEMKIQEVPASTSANIPTGGMAYVPVSKLYDLMDMRDGDRGGLYETARDKKRVAEIVEQFKKKGYNSTDGWYQTIYVDIDAGGYGWIGEGNHRVLAARQLGMTHLPVRVEFGEARDGRYKYNRNYARVATQVISEEKIEELKKQAGPYYHIKYASIWETDLPTNKEPITKEQIDWQPSLFGRDKVNNTIITRSQLLQQAVQDLLEGKITNKEYQETVDIVSQVDPIAKFFLPASNQDMENALGKGKAKKLNIQLEDGEYVGLRLDIPAYVNNNIWVVTAHKGNGAPLTYGSVAWATDVKFGTNPKVAAFIAAGKNMDLVGRYRIDPVEVDGKTVYKFFDTKTGKYYAEKGKEVTKNDYKVADRFVADRLEKQDKSTIGKMLGKWKNFEGETKEDRDASAIKKVEEIVKIENSYPGAGRKGSSWRQIGMNPFRHSYFYDRRNGKPVVAAAEVVQIGGLVYAKDVEYADWSSDQFTVDGYYDADGVPVKFQVETELDKKLFRELEKGEIPEPLYKKSWYQKVHSALFRTELEKEVLKLQEKREARISETEQDSRLISNRIKKYAKTPEALKLANEYLTADNKKDAKEAILKLPNGEKLLSSLREARAFIDNISVQLNNDMAFDGLPDDLRIAIQDNITTYLRSSYRFFTDKSFKIEKRRNPAIQAQFNQLVAREIGLMGSMGMSDLDIGEYIESIREDLSAEAVQMIDSYISSLEDIKYQPSVTGGGIKMPNAPFKKKKELPDYIKQLLGEEKNPVNRFAQTSKSLANILYKGKMLEGIIDIVGENSDYILSEQPDSLKEKQYKKVNDPYSLLDGKWVHNEIMDMVDQKPLYSAESLSGKAYFNTLKLARKSKVIWNITTWRKNLTGGWFFIMANGIANPKFAKDFLNRTNLMFVKTGEGKTVGVGKFKYTFEVDEETKKLMKLLAQYGVSGKSVDANLIGISQAAYQFALDGDENTYYERAKAIFSNISKKDKWLQEKYAAVDDYTKLIIFRSEIQSYAKKLYGKEYSELNEKQKDNVHEQAAERVKQSTPTFSRLPKWYPKVAIVPVVGDFISFRLESLRSYGMNVANAISDIKKSQEAGLDNVQKKEYLTAGLRRLAGSGAVFAIKLAITKLLAQYFLDDDDEKLEEDAKLLRPEWMSGQSIIPKSIDKDGNVRAYNYSSEDPYGDVSDVFGGPSSWEAMAKDFIRPNIAADLIFNLAKGEDIYGRKIVDYSDSRINNVKNLLGYTLKQIVVPPTVSSSFRDAYLRSELPKKDKIVNLATMIAERSLIRDYKYNVVDTFVQDLRKISETRKSYIDYDNPDKRLGQLDEIKRKYESIVKIGTSKKNYDMIDKAKRYLKTHLPQADEEYVLDGIIKKK